ncbi:MAG: tetratricopeptide repeat protein [Chloroflexi bacterium]|nr:MAG: tetratricopeptide repeat protein [Chloroflexota bacterium]
MSIAKDAKTLPVMLPAGKLVGREAELQSVYAQLKEGNTVLLHGPSGAGKTALAATLASAYVQQPGGVLWMNVHQPSLEELLVRVGRAYDIQEITNSDSPLGMIGAVENTIKSNKPLVVIDGTINPDIASRFIARCVDRIPAIVISQRAVEGAWALVGLDKLQIEQAAALFKREARITTDEHDIDVYGIVKQVDTLPFGVVVAARAMLASKATPADFIKTTQQIASSLGGHSPAVGLTASFRALNGALQGLLLMMGASFNGMASADLLSMVSGAPLHSVEQAMNLLTQLNLVERVGDRLFRLHQITYAFAQSTLKNANKLDGLQQKIRNSLVPFIQQHAQNFDVLAREMALFMAAAQWASDRGDRQLAADLASALDKDFVRERGYLYEQLQLRAMGSGSATPFPAYPQETTPPSLSQDDESGEDNDFPEDELLDDSDEYEVDEDALEVVEDDELSPEDMLMPDTTDLDHKSTSELRSILIQVKQAGDITGQINVLKAIGKQQVADGMENEAIATYTEVLNIYESLDDEEGTLETLDMLSALMVKTRNAQAAQMYASRGVKLAEDLGDDVTRLQLLITLGEAHEQLGETDQSKAAFSRALATARQTDDKQHEAIALYKLGYAQLDDGDPETAIETLEQALELFKAQGKRAYEGKVKGGLGSAHGELDRWAEAVSFHTSAVHLAREVGDKEEEAVQLSSLAYAAVQANQLGEAVLRYRQALHLAYEADDKENIVSTVVDLARLLLKSRKYLLIAEALIDDALTYEPNDKDLKQLKEHIENEKELAQQSGTKFAPMNGSAQRYAENAYRLLEA